MLTLGGLRRALPLFTFLLLVVGLSACPGQVTMWNFIQYTVYTGGDDLSGGRSIAVAYLTLNNGANYACALNSPGTSVVAVGMPPIPGFGYFSAQTFDNDSTQTVTCPLGASGINIPGSTLTVRMDQKSCDTSCDNWDLEGLAATLYTSNPDTSPGTGTSACLLRAGYFGPGDNGGNPQIFRFKGGQGDGGIVVASLPNPFTLPSCH